MRRLYLAVLALLLTGGGLGAEEPHDTIRESLVYIRATALSNDKDPAGQGRDIEARATGFFVSSDGLILTNYHILDQLGYAVPSTIRFQVSVGEKSADARTALTVDGNEISDLLLLKAVPAVAPYVTVTLGSAYRHPEGDRVYTSGFPRDISYRKGSGEIAAREGPGGALWSIDDLRIRSGQSGSPVYDARGAVIGVLKADDDSAVYMIPIDAADGLIAQVRIRDLTDRLETLEAAALRSVPDVIDVWVPDGQDRPLGVSVDDAICFLSAVQGKFDHGKDEIGLIVRDGQYVLIGDQGGSGTIKATPLCLALR
jgi:hypothetical protein